MTDFDQQEFDATQKYVKERQFHRNHPKAARDLISRLLARKGYAQQQTSVQFDQAWLQALQQTKLNHRVGLDADGNKAKTKPGNLRRGVLEIYVESSLYLQQLEFKKRELLQAMQQKLPNLKLIDLRFKIGNVNAHE